MPLPLTRAATRHAVCKGSTGPACLYAPAKLLAGKAKADDARGRPVMDAGSSAYVFSLEGASELRAWPQRGGMARLART